MSGSDIDAQRDQHLNSLHKELKALYTKAKGYPDDFGKLPRNVQLALFDMVFNLGAHKLSNSYPSFNKALKASDWKKAAKESKRNGIQDDRNQYVKKLLESVPAATGTTP